MNYILAQTTVQEMFEAFQERFWALSGAIIWILCWAVPVVALSYGIYFLISPPLRRQERARMLLDLVETGLRRGQSAEQAVVAAAASGDAALGARFHLLAAYIEDGRRLTEALDRVPRLLPPPVVAMLKVGVELGDLGRVLPACRKQLKDGLSQTRSGMNFVLVLVFIIMPVFPLVFLTISTWVVPRMQAIFMDMVEGGVPPTCWSLPLAVRLMGVHAALVGLLQVLMICYVGGPRLKSWCKRSAWLGLWTDRLLWRLPWRRERMKRDFAMMLALLLDAGVPEARALVLASGSTANRYFERRAEQAGIRSSVIVLLGLGGKKNSAEHVRETITALNRMQPRYLSFLSLMVIPGTPLAKEVRQGEFTELDAAELLKEAYEMIRGLELKRTVFRSNHASTYLALEGTFPKDKPALLKSLKAALDGETRLRPDFVRGL